MQQGGVLCAAHVCHCGQAAVREADAPRVAVGLVCDEVHNGALRAGENNRDAVSSLLESKLSSVECSARESIL